jgi:hypothetical protein
MSSEKVDYGPVIADLESKISTLQGTVAMLKALAGGGFVTAVLADGSTVSMGTPYDLPVGILVGKSLPEAIKLYLDAVKKKQTKDQIMVALKEGGYESTAADFGKAVSTALHRLKNSKEVLRFPDGWGLASLYPESFRARLEEQNAKSTKKPKKKRSSSKGRARTASKNSPIRRARADSERTSEKPSEVKTTDTPKGSIEQRALEIILNNPSRTYKPIDLSKMMNARVQTLALLLGKLAHKGTIDRGGNGYHAPKQSTH